MSEDLDAELRRLAASTESVRPTAGFEARVLSRIPRAPRWDDSVVRFGRTMLVVAALSAAVSAVVGFQSDRDEAQASATTYGMEELDW